MSNEELSNTFATLLNSYSTKVSFGNQTPQGGIVLDEYEKSLFLTAAQEDIVVSLYNGKNPFGDSFESTEELRRYLDSLVLTKVYTMDDKVDRVGVSPSSIFFTLPDKLAFITLEQVTFEDDSLGCYNGSYARVYPISQDEFTRVVNNPFRGATKYKVLRLDSGDGIVELVSKYKIKEYLVKYMSKPEPIVLEDLPDGLTIEGVSKQTDCKLNEILHYPILNKAVQFALQSKSIGISK